MSTEPNNPFESQGAEYDKHSPRSVECPYVLTGNASEDWQDFFVAAYRFGKWASETDVGGGNHIVMELGRNLGPEEIDGETKECLDGLTLRLGEGGWAADIVGHWHELLGALPWGMPDGELEIHFPHDSLGKDVNGGRNYMCVLHLWHD